MGVSHGNPLNRTSTVGWFRVERIPLPQQRCRKARCVERQLVLGGPSLVEALPPLRCVTPGRELAMGHLFTHLQSRTRQGSSDQFASGSLPATFGSGEVGKTGFKMADAELGSLRAHARHPRPGESLKSVLLTQSPRSRLAKECKSHVATAGCLNPLCSIPDKWPVSLCWDLQWWVSHYGPERPLPSKCSNLQEVRSSARVRMCLPVASSSWS